MEKLEIYNKAEKFVKNLPYMNEPYNKRGWGNKWHSLCSYHGKLKPSIAHILIRDFTEKGDVVLDPLSGVGTIPFEACLQGRIGLANDLSDLAYIVSTAKVSAPKKENVYIKIKNLENYIEKRKNKYSLKNLPYENFGFNGKLPDYFHINTYKEILAAREFLETIVLDGEYAVIFSALLHVLHGNRPYALSRNSHPLVPYAPTGDFIYKNVIEHVTAKIDLSYKKMNLYSNIEQTSILKRDIDPDDWSKYKYGKSYNYNVLELDKKDLPMVDTIITSPPFANSIKFYSQNWMRLWLSGWEEDDFNNAKFEYLDSLQKDNLEIYEEFFKVCYNLIKENGIMILHLGKSKKYNMAEELSKIGSNYFETIFMGDENVTSLEKHGIKDKGGTTHHQYLFLKKK